MIAKIWILNFVTLTIIIGVLALVVFGAHWLWVGTTDTVIRATKWESAGAVLLILLVIAGAAYPTRCRWCGSLDHNSVNCREIGND